MKESAFFVLQVKKEERVSGHMCFQFLKSTKRETLIELKGGYTAIYHKYNIKVDESILENFSQNQCGMLNICLNNNSGVISFFFLSPFSQKSSP